MRTFWTWGWICCLAIGGADWQTATSADADHVVIISVDGLPAYLLSDPNASLPTIRGLAKSGAYAEGMIASNPSVTWPNHTSLVTGVRPAKHGVLFNGVLERGGPGLPVRVNPRTDRRELVHAPTLDEVLLKAGKTTVSINWPCTRNSGTLAVDFPDSPDTLNYTTPEFLQELHDAGILSAEQRDGFNKLMGPARDEVWTRAACHAIRTRKPPLLLLHLLNLDSSHHKYGPLTLGGYSAVAIADRWVQEVVQALTDAGIRERTTIFVVSDHGFIAIPKTIQPNVVLRQAGLLTVEGNNVTAAKVHAYPEGGIAMVYLTVPETRAADRDRVIELFKNHEGIADIVLPSDFAKYGLPHPDDYQQMADLILSAKDGYAFNATATGDSAVVESTGTLGTHGFLSTNPKMNAFFVASGAGIRPGSSLGVIENIDVAPTAAKLLGMTLPEVDGRVLTEILSPSR